MENAPARCLVIVTGLPASGKTLLAAELAGALARWREAPEGAVAALPGGTRD